MNWIDINHSLIFQSYESIIIINNVDNIKKKSSLLCFFLYFNNNVFNFNILHIAYMIINEFNNNTYTLMTKSIDECININEIYISISSNLISIIVDSSN